MSEIDESVLWFNSLVKRKNPSIRLFCFPYAGGGSVVFREWYNKLPPEIEMYVAQLPGRESRFSEELPNSIDGILHYLKRDIQPYIHEPFAFFGHSMGALIAYELSRTLMKEQNKQPLRLFVSGKSAPHLKSNRPPLYNLPKNEFIKELTNFNGTPKEIINNEEVMSYFEPKLRRDFEVCDTYKYINNGLLSCPITIYGGIDDDMVSNNELEAWGDLTKNYYKVHLFKGDHFFIYNNLSFIIDSIKEYVTKQ